MGGKSKADNSQVVQQQQQEAADAKQKEADRQARIDKGLSSIKAAFEGSPVMGTKTQNFDWSKFTAPTFVAQQQAAAAGDPNWSVAGATGLPQGFKLVQTDARSGTGGSASTSPSAAYASSSGQQPSTPPTSASPAASHPVLGQAPARSTGVTTANPNDPTWIAHQASQVGPPGRSVTSAPVQYASTAGGGNGWGTAAGVSSTQAAFDSRQAASAASQPASSKVWALQGPDGKLYYQGDPLSYDSSYDTGQHSGGFDDAFYNKYKQAVLDYYMPQVDKQYKDARNELTYRLARAGNLRSSAANTTVADLASQNDINQAGVRNQADTAAGDLRTQVAGEQAKAVSQLYATEDPNVAANQATEAVKNISLSQPSLSPLSAIFDVATVGGANALKGYQNQRLANTYQNVAKIGGAQRVVTG